MHIKNPFHTINAIIFIMFNRIEHCENKKVTEMNGKIENDID